MKRTLSVVLLLAILAVSALSFAGCGSMKGVYTDENGNTWTFTGSKLKVDSTLTLDKVAHSVTAVYEYDTAIVVSEDGTEESEQLTLVLKKYKYNGYVGSESDNKDDRKAKEAVGEQAVKEMNALVDLKTKEGKTTVFTIRRDAEKGETVTLSKTGATITLTVKQ